MRKILGTQFFLLYEAKITRNQCYHRCSFCHALLYFTRITYTKGRNGPAGSAQMQEYLNFSYCTNSGLLKSYGRRPVKGLRERTFFFKAKFCLVTVTNGRYY